MNQPHNDEKIPYRGLLWTGFAAMVATVVIAGLLMILSIVSEQYLWLIPIAAYLLWLVNHAERTINRWARWVAQLQHRR